MLETMRSNKRGAGKAAHIVSRGVKRMVFVLDKKLLKKKAMKS